MIEFWPPRSRRARNVPPEELKDGLAHFLVNQKQLPNVEVAMKGLAAFIVSLHGIQGLEGVAFSWVYQLHAPPTCRISILAPSGTEDGESARITRAAIEADAELAWQLHPVMPTGLFFYDSKNMEPGSFVQALRNKSRRSRTEELAGVFLFNRNN